MLKFVFLRYLYSVLFYLLLPFIFLRLLWRSFRRSVDYRQKWGERLGYCPHQLDKCIWVHAVSVGETIAATPLIKALLNRYPEIPVLITNMTITGAARVKATFGDKVLQAYVPYDLPVFAMRFLRRANPVAAIIIETELWPNIFAACQTQHIPVVVVNARLSAKSAQGYQHFAAVTYQMLQAIQMLAVQTTTEADRFIKLGMPADRIAVTGNIKFDLEIPANLNEKSISLRAELGNRLIWVAASTHASEEEIVLAVHRQILQQFPSALLVLVPRHPERFNTVFDLGQQQGFEIVRRSQGESCQASTQIYLADTMGEMLLMYSICDVAFIGGSFAPIGGHNMLEAAVLSKPIITGPHLFNFLEISQLLISAGGMVKVENQTELFISLSHLFQDENYRREVGQKGEQFVKANRGALAKQLQLVQQFIR